MHRKWILALACAALTLGCVVGPASGPQGPSDSSGLPETTAATAGQVERLRRLMLPLLAVMNRRSARAGERRHPRPNDINAANAGSGRCDENCSQAMTSTS
jgi:hypothetical protein